MINFVYTVSQMGLIQYDSRSDLFFNFGTCTCIFVCEQFRCSYYGITYILLLVLEFNNQTMTENTKQTND